MATWKIQDKGIEKCENCGATYKVTAQQFPVPEKDNFRCECGHVMHEWKGTTTFNYELIEKEKSK